MMICFLQKYAVFSCFWTTVSSKTGTDLSLSTQIYYYVVLKYIFNAELLSKVVYEIPLRLTRPYSQMHGRCDIDRYYRYFCYMFCSDFFCFFSTPTILQSALSTGCSRKNCTKFAT